MKNGGKKIVLNIANGYSSDGKAAIFTLGFAYLYLLVEIVIRMKTEKRICVWEIILLFLLYAVFGFFKKLFHDNTIPKDHKGNPLPTGDDRTSVAERNSYYKKSALIYASVFAVINFAALMMSTSLYHVNLAIEIFFDTKVPNIIVALVLTAAAFLLLFIISYFTESLWAENKIENYKKAHPDDFFGKDGGDTDTSALSD